jgi:peptide deformylase
MKEEEIQEAEPKYHLVTPDDPILKQVQENFDFKNPPIDPLELAADLSNHMVGYGGIGLAAPQLGLPYRVFALRGDPNYVCFNPRITAFGPDEILLDEGCLTYPLFFLKIKRPRFIRVRFQVPGNGRWKTERLDGISARVYQHELDHLNGILFTEKVSRLKLEYAQNKQRKLLKKITRENRKKRKANRV